MTTSASKPRQIRRERRIIERPRLIKMLDECEARVILLLAPAGYGKTTLARQWAKTLNGAVWISLTPAHRDVATFAEDIAAGIDDLGGDAKSFISQYVRARSNPQRAAREVATALARQLTKAHINWLVLDDYHEILSSSAIEEMVNVLHERTSARLLIASREKPTWATSRLTVYGQTEEIGREQLAMTEDEAVSILGQKAKADELLAKARGWPAVLALAAAVPSPEVSGVLPSALHQFIADEVFRSISPRLRAQLISLALLPDLTWERLRSTFPDAPSVVRQARELGFLSHDEVPELHPLLRDFLLTKLRDSTGASEAARTAVEECIRSQSWDRAFDLVHRFALFDLIEPLLEAAYKPLVRCGRLGTLSAFATAVRAAPTFPPPEVDLIETEVALRDGAFGLSVRLAERVAEQLPEGHALLSRAHYLRGQSAFAQGAIEVAEHAYASAYRSARDDQDEGDALHGWALATIQGELGDSEAIFARIAERRRRSPFDLVRYGTADLARRRFGEGVAGTLDIDEPLHAVPLTDDPRARTSFLSTASYVLALRAEYHRAMEFARLAVQDIDSFDLEFARPYADWIVAHVNLGLRRFGATERALQLVEDAAAQRPLGYHVLNIRILRARLALESGDPVRAVAHVRLPDTEAAIPSLHAEYRATAALCEAVSGDFEAASRFAGEAEIASSAVEVRVLAQAARSHIAATVGDEAEVRKLPLVAARLGALDPMIAALRSSRILADAIAEYDDLRPALATLYEQSNDLGLARRAGLRTRSSRSPTDLLSPRELEVLGLVARGLRNREIARALVISESTTKVHVRHVLEKLGVRTRAEAASRFEMFS